MKILQVPADQDPSVAIGETELELFGTGEELLGERHVFDHEGRVRPDVVELVFADPSLTEDERRRLGLLMPDQVVGAGPEIGDEEPF